MVEAEGSLPPQCCVTQNKWFSLSVSLLARNSARGLERWHLRWTQQGMDGLGEWMSSLWTKLRGGQDRVGVWQLWAL